MSRNRDDSEQDVVELALNDFADSIEKRVRWHLSRQPEASVNLDNLLASATEDERHRLKALEDREDNPFSPELYRVLRDLLPQAQRRARARLLR